MEANNEALVAFNGLVGVFMPLLINKLTTSKSSREFKTLVGFLTSIIIGILTLVITHPRVNPADISTSLFMSCVSATIISTNLSYSLYFKGKFTK